MPKKPQTSIEYIIKHLHKKSLPPKSIKKKLKQVMCKHAVPTIKV
jgi:hypothetical protein